MDSYLIYLCTPKNNFLFFLSRSLKFTSAKSGLLYFMDYTRIMNIMRIRERHCSNKY